ncbi:MAG: 2-amino-4-hydroxy-6-hydroxymethyldihydropteridine diphosphokinase [Lachnospiraceae bacterium]|nr:2-amino-4-hydroxy-6-hydroxymethyldihydropteridine diphosphokinase [Lachnospiraceae bacterium]
MKKEICDRIIIKNLEVFAYHGVFGFEKQKGQTFYISAVIYTDTQKAGLNDNLDDTVSYAEICEKIHEFNEKNAFDLIETAAEKLAVYLLNGYEKIAGIDIEISKPYAPVKEKVENLAVRIFRCRHKAYIAFGSNMGDSMALIDEGIEKIDKDENCKVIKKSSVIKTKPYGGVEQDDFYNGVIEIETYLKPYALLDLLHRIEAEAGRERKIHWGPRTLDLDILLYDDSVINEEHLTIPHGDMGNRMFVLQPLAEIAPWEYHPVTKKTIAEMKKELESLNC